jgi:hypothetical protein
MGFIPVIIMGAYHCKRRRGPKKSYRWSLQKTRDTEESEHASNFVLSCSVRPPPRQAPSPSSSPSSLACCPVVVVRYVRLVLSSVSPALLSSPVQMSRKHRAKYAAVAEDPDSWQKIKVWTLRRDYSAYRAQQAIPEGKS